MRTRRGVVVRRLSTGLAGLLAVLLTTLMGCSDAVPSDDSASLGVAVQGVDYYASHRGLVPGQTYLVTMEGFANNGAVTFTSTIYDGNLVLDQLVSPSITYGDFGFPLADGDSGFDSVTLVIVPGDQDVVFNVFFSSPNIIEGFDAVVNADGRPEFRSLSLGPSPIMEDNNNEGGQPFSSNASISDIHDVSDGGNDIIATATFDNGQGISQTYNYAYVGSDLSFGEERENFRTINSFPPDPTGSSRSFLFIAEAVDAAGIDALAVGIGVSIIPPGTLQSALLNDPADALTISGPTVTSTTTDWTVNLNSAGAPVAGASIMGWDTNDPTNYASGTTNVAGDATISLPNRIDGQGVSNFSAHATFVDLNGAWHADQSRF